MNRIAGLALVMIAACSRWERPLEPPPVPLTQPARICRGEGPGTPCLSAAEVERWLQSPELDIRSAARTPRGVQSAYVMTLSRPAPSRVVFRAKWRAHSTETNRNSPRRELAAHAIQKLFLDPEDWVVPPAAPHCFPLAAYRAAVDPAARPTFPGTDCVYGVLSYWLEDVQRIRSAESDGWLHGKHDHAFDPYLFRVNPVYRDAVANVNILTYLIGHGDSHPNNFLITRDPDAPRIYSVDNSISLGLDKASSLRAKHDWSVIRVPAVPRAAVERLRARDDRVRKLATIAVLARRGGGLAVVRGARAPLRPTDDGVDWDGERLRVGLTAGEIADLRARIDALVFQIDTGALGAY